jgi:hypothetical protein
MVNEAYCDLIIVVHTEVTAVFMYLDHSLVSYFLPLRGSRSWGKPRHLLMGETPKTAVAPQDRAALSLREIKIVWFIYLKIAVRTSN